MKAILYTFSKRANSSARPTAGREMEIFLKAPTSIHNPTFRIKSEAFPYNYIYVPSLSTYYKIMDVISMTSDIWEAVCVQDLLATYRDDILNSATYVEYAGTAYDPMIPDGRCARYVQQYTINDGILMPGFEFQTGAYVVSVLNDSVDNEDFIAHYMLDSTGIKALSAYLNDTALVWSDIIKIVNNPIEAILRIIWVPFYYSEGTQTTVHIGNQDTGIAAYRLSRTVKSGHITMAIPWTYDDFRRLEPWTSLSIFLPFYGTVAINPSNYINLNNLDLFYAIDATTGDITMSIGAVSGDYRQIVNYNCSANIPVAQMLTNVSALTSDILSVASGTIGLLGSASIGNYPAAISSGISAAVGIANTILDSQTPTKTIKGNLQGRSMLALGRKIYIINTWYTTDDPDDYAFIKGRPIMDYAGLQQYRGFYVKTSSTSIELTNATAEETDAVNTLLMQGIFLE